jgi:hypothetical protein
MIEPYALAGLGFMLAAMPRERTGLNSEICSLGIG